MMDDRISDLPDCVISYILSFLPTKDAVATCVLSKRWKPLWRSVSALDFECPCKIPRKLSYDDCPCGRPLWPSVSGLNLDCYCRRRFYRYSIKRGITYNLFDPINAFLCSRDPLQSLRRFRLDFSDFCDPSHIRICYPTNVYQLIFDAVVHHKLEHLSLCLPSAVDFPSVLLSCKTLVVLELCYFEFRAPFSVDLPSLKIMHLCSVFFSQHIFVADLLSGCPNLEVMEVSGIGGFVESYATQAKFQKLPKLVRAVFYKDLLPLEVVSNVQFLCIEKMDKEVEIIEDLIPRFHNLIRIEFHCALINLNWLEVFKVINHCPKLQHLLVHLISYDPFTEDERPDWKYTESVPLSISSHLKTCRLINYAGFEADFEFAKYIMKNASVLHKMVIRTCPDTSRREKRKMRKKLSLFSSTCKLSLK